MPSEGVVIRHGKKAGVSGYRRGCRCGECRKAKREDQAAYRAKRKLAAAGVALPDVSAEIPPQIEASSLQIAFSRPPGAIETALAEELDALIGEPPFKKTLMVLAKYNARVLDQIPALDRPDLISGMQSRLFNVFDRLRKVEGPVGDEDAAEAFLRSLAEPGSD
jgi:hypothetical protein